MHQEPGEVMTSITSSCSEFNQQGMLPGDKSRAASPGGSEGPGKPSKNYW